MMARLFLLFLLAASAWPANEYIVFGVFGGRTLHRGHSLYLVWYGGWVDAYEFTVDLDTDTIVAPGHTIATGNDVYYISTGTLPAPLQSRNPYAARNAACTTAAFGAGAAFRLYEPNAATCLTFDENGTGTHKLGKYISLNGDVDPTANAVFGAFTGLPAGVTYTWVRNTVTCGGSPCQYNGRLTVQPILKLTAATDAALGVATFTVPFTVGGANRTQDVTITVAAEPLNSLPGMSTPVPLARTTAWHNMMNTLAQRWYEPTRTYSFGYAEDVWYYDGMRVYHRAADLFGNANYRNFAFYLEAQYRKWLMVDISPAGAGAAYRRFTKGVRRSTNWDGRSRYMLAKMQENGLGQTGGVLDREIREVAYRLETCVDYERTFRKRDPHLLELVDMSVGIMDQLFVTEDISVHQVHYDGLMMRALIDYWEMRRDQEHLRDPDPRIPYYIKIALDWLWAHAWDGTARTYAYIPYPRGNNCIAVCIGMPDSGTWGLSVVGILVPAFGWYYSVSGDETYSTRGDAIFNAIPMALSGTATAADDTFTVAGHGLTANEYAAIMTPVSGALPGNTYNGEPCYARDIVGDTFKCSTTSGGAPINLTTNGNAMIFIRPDVWAMNDKGKTFAVNFQWSEDYIDYREGRKPVR